MEVKGAAILYTLAGAMITFAGFSALLLGIRQAAGHRLAVLDRFLAKTVLLHIFILTGAALVPPLLALYDIGESTVWKISAVAFAVAMLGHLLSYPHRRRSVIGKNPPAAVTVIYIGLGAAAPAVMTFYVLYGFQHAAAAYITALVINFFTLGFAFIAAMDVIMQQPGDRS